MNEGPAVIDVPPPRRRWDEALHDWWAPHWRKLQGPFWVLFFVALFLLVWLFNLIFINIYPGNAGVLWRRFGGGTDMTRVYGGGLWVINPFNRMYIYQTRMQQRETNFTALTSNGLTITIHASVRFSPEVKNLPRLHEQLGPDYVDTVVIPQVQSVIRKIIGAYEPEQIYGTQGNILQNVRLTAMAELRARYILLDDLLIREIVLPPRLASAIEDKLSQEQLDLQYKYILDRERQEAERKKIEAEGILAFQQTVGKDLTENYLQLMGIDATVQLASSPNAKIVVFGNNPSGLPLILNTGESLTAAPAGRPAAGLAPTVGPVLPSPPPMSSARPPPAATLAVPPAVEKPAAAGAMGAEPQKRP